MALSIDPVTGLQNASLPPASTRSATGGKDLGSVDFMKLIIAQMRNQNPLDPEKDSDFMAQMAQFEALNQTKATAQGMRVLQGLSELSSATSLLGKTIIGRQVNAVGITRDGVAREIFGAPYSSLSTDQRTRVNLDERVQAAAADAQNSGREVSGRVDRVVVGPDGIPMLSVNGRAVDLFTVSEVR